MPNPLVRIKDAVLDASIVFSFDRSGYERHARRFDSTDLDLDLSGQIFAVTGSNGGIGKEIARGLAARGADVHLLCRNAERAEAARQDIAATTGSARLFVEELDVSDFASIRAFAERWSAPRIDGLIHNAGLIPEKRIETDAGLEMTAAAHVVGPYLLTRLLEPKLRAAKAPRVVWMSSGGMYTTALSLGDIDWKKREYDGVAAYAQTKRMQVVLSELLAQAWRESGIVSHCLHPGWAETPGIKDALPGFSSFMARRMRSPEQGADTAIWLAAAAEPGRSSGRFWLDRRPVRTHYLRTRESEDDRRDFARWVAERSGIPFPGDSAAPDAVAEGGASPSTEPGSTAEGAPV